MFASLSLLLALVAPQPTPSRAIERSQCDAPRWTAAPIVQDKKFFGTLAMRCTIVTAGDGDYRKLAETYEQETAAQTTVHAGPIEATYDNLPAVRYDVTLNINEEGMKTVRTDTYIATDGTDRFVVAALSKQINATGLAANVVRMDNTVRVQRGSEPRSHVVEVESRTEVKKPALIGVETFKGIVINQAESKMKTKGPETVGVIAENL